jgi:hypothetical protein
MDGFNKFNVIEIFACGNDAHKHVINFTNITFLASLMIKTEALSKDCTINSFHNFFLQQYEKMIKFMYRAQKMDLMDMGALF